MVASILVVDDEEPVRRSLVRLLAFEDYHLHQAADGREALRILDQQRIDVVVTDHHMAGMNGVELLRAVIPRDPTISRILFSGHIDVELIREAVNDGDVNHFISKPWDDDELLLAVRQCSERTAWLREQQAAEARNRRRTEALEESNSSLSGRVRHSTHALRLSQEILDKLPVMVIGLDLDGHVALVNAMARHSFPECVPGDALDGAVPADLAVWALDRKRAVGDSISVSHDGGLWRFEVIPLDDRGIVLAGQPEWEADHVE